MRLGLVEASEQRISSPVDQLLLASVASDSPARLELLRRALSFDTASDQYDPAKSRGFIDIQATELQALQIDLQAPNVGDLAGRGIPN